MLGRPEPVVFMGRVDRVLRRIHFCHVFKLNRSNSMFIYVQCIYSYYCDRCNSVSIATWWPGCSTGHDPRLLHVSRQDMNQTNVKHIFPKDGFMSFRKFLITLIFVQVSDKFGLNYLFHDWQLRLNLNEYLYLYNKALTADKEPRKPPVQVNMNTISLSFLF